MHAHACDRSTRQFTVLALFENFEKRKIENNWPLKRGELANRIPTDQEASRRTPKAHSGWLRTHAHAQQSIKEDPKTTQWPPRKNTNQRDVKTRRTRRQEKYPCSPPKERQRASIPDAETAQWTQAKAQCRHHESDHKYARQRHKSHMWWPRRRARPVFKVDIIGCFCAEIYE